MRGDVTDARRRRTSEDRATQPMEAGGWVSQISPIGMVANKTAQWQEINKKQKLTGIIISTVRIIAIMTNMVDLMKTMITFCRGRSCRGHPLVKCRHTVAGRRCRKGCKIHIEGSLGKSSPRSSTPCTTLDRRQPDLLSKRSINGSHLKGHNIQTQLRSFHVDQEYWNTSLA